VPSYSVLDSITHLSHIADVYLKFANEKQFGPSALAFRDIHDTLKAYAERNPNIKITKGKIFTKFDPTTGGAATFKLVEIFAELGITLEQDPAYKSVAKNNGTGTENNPYKGRKSIISFAKNGGKGKNPFGKNFTAYKTNKQNNSKTFYSNEFVLTA